jgi:hypothetical protein
MLNGRTSFSPRPSEPAQPVTVPAGVSRPTVWRWQQRYVEAEVEGRLRDKTREPGKARIAAEVTARAVALIYAAAASATHWTGRAMAKATGISLRSLQHTWQAYQLQLHRIRTFKSFARSEFFPHASRHRQLYADHPVYAVVLSLNEKVRSKQSTEPAGFTDRGRAMADQI